MLTWEDVKPADLLRRWAAIGIVAAAMEFDDIDPKGIEVAKNSINEFVRCGTTIHLGYFRGEPVAVVTRDSGSVTVHVLPHVRHHQLEHVALNYAVNENVADGHRAFGFFAENLEIYRFAQEIGFQRPEFEGDFRDEMLRMNPVGYAVLGALAPVSGASARD